MTGRRTRAVLVLLSTCAGGMDLLAVAALGGVFGGIVTGDLIHVGHGIGTGAWVAAGTAGVAVLSFTVGVTLAAWGLGRREPVSARRVTGALGVELVLLAVFAVGWALARGRPEFGVVSMSLLATAAMALGGQSTISLRLGGSTTYMTGTLTTAIGQLVSGGGVAGALSLLARPVGLLAGAAATTLVLVAAPMAAVALPVGCATAALLCRWERPWPRGTHAAVSRWRRVVRLLGRAARALRGRWPGTDAPAG